ncbi:MAG: hypothetical protein AB7V42_06940 [Thermoleophilia bacterium]
MHHLSPRDSLLLAFADLASHGIETRCAARGSVEDTRGELREMLEWLFPDGARSYAFWTAADDSAIAHAAAFGGEAVVRLHCSDEWTAEAARAAIATQSLTARPSREPSVVEVVIGPGDADRTTDAAGSPGQAGLADR